MSTVIQIENLWKEYRLGVIGHGTLTHDLQSWWARVRGQEDPNSKIPPILTEQESQIDGDHFWALQNINLEVKQGEILGIIGKNGAGKSTLLKILSRVTAPTKGDIKIKGRIASLLEVGTGFHPELTGRENVFMNGAILGMSKLEIISKLDEIIDFSGVENFIDTPVKRYSSGMYVRLAFAVAAHLEPEILVIDEVLAVGDAQFQKKCLGKMQNIGKEGRTVLFVSHNMTAMRSICENVIVLQDGCIECRGTSEKMVTKYLSNFTKTSLQKKWNNCNQRPHNSYSILRSVVVKDISGGSLEKIQTNTPMQICIEYEVVATTDTVGFTIVIYDAEGNCVLSTLNNREKNYFDEKLSGEKYVSKINIPGNFFNNGIYTVSLIMYGPNFSEATIVKDVLTLELLDSIEIRGNYQGDYSGCVRPDFLWSSFRLSDRELS